MHDQPPTDSLSAPLGRMPRKRSRAIPKAVPVAVAAVLGALLTGFAGWIALVDDPLGGEPVAIVSTKPVPVARAASEPAGGPARAAPRQTVEPSSEPPPGTQTVTIIDGMSGKRQQVTIAATPEAEREGQVPDDGLVETSRHGPIPKIGPDGARSSEVYAIRRAGAAGGGPRVALVVGRLGISGRITAEALAKLPSPMTLAFTPYGIDLSLWAARARDAGHEVLLQAPMEPLDYPDNDPGPQTLLTSLAPDQNIDRLHWSMSRLRGYVGLANYMGARFLTNEQAMSAIMRDLGQRGLIFFDNGAAARGLAGEIAGAAHVPYAKAHVTIDGALAPAAIDAALMRLETTARERGVAVGYVNALPTAIDRIARWAKAAGERGVALVPITAVAVKAGSS